MEEPERFAEMLSDYEEYAKTRNVLPCQKVTIKEGRFLEASLTRQKSELLS